MQQSIERAKDIAIYEQIDRQPTTVTIVHTDRANKNLAIKPKPVVDARLSIWRRLSGFVSLLAILPVL